MTMYAYAAQGTNTCPSYSITPAKIAGGNSRQLDAICLSIATLFALLFALRLSLLRFPLGFRVPFTPSRGLFVYVRL